MTERLWGVPPFVLGCGFALLGYLLSLAVGAEGLAGTGFYLEAAGLLLAVGLYASTSAIDLAETREHLRTVLLVVTVGVVFKAVFIAGVMLLFFRDPRYLVLGIAVAQIDPLSVAALQKSSLMSARAKSLLFAWASFDDPMTVLLTFYFSSLALSWSGEESGLPTAGGDGLGSFAAGISANLAFAVLAGALWWFLVHRRAADRKSTLPVWPFAVALLGFVFLAGHFYLMLGLALIGLFWRPAIGDLVDRLVFWCFLLSAFALGLLLVEGVDLLKGVVLGVAAFAGQAIVSLVMPGRGLSRGDRVFLAIGQQNGITAIILALTLRPDFEEAVAIIGPAILVVNLLHYVTNRWWTRRMVAVAGKPDMAGAGEEVPGRERT
ncbi:hypothetical protein DPM19_13645 [Actinomadura craniellae]|uniref:Cation/H+ exchanger domain-containing protein n=1 Tax=Actinomadura craniellae TaxID=2231787 RepID=A0A365H6Y6_9ACTN|nr:hypothetical protein [Actinomadura craniellae]RAY14778.1 hypothetical protein DPM19_13645 [Actinomadura craniellae]